MSNIDVSNVLSFVLSQFRNIIAFTFNTMDRIKLANDLSMLDLLIMIAIIGTIVPILITSPSLKNTDKQTVKSKSNRKEKQ